MSKIDGGITEDEDSRQMTIEKGGKRTLVRSFLVEADTASDAVIMGPPYGSGFSGSKTYLKSKSVALVDPGIYRLKCNYESPDPVNNPPVDYVFWDIDNGTQNIKIYSIKKPSDRHEYPTTLRWAGRTAINEDDQGNIDGVDVRTPFTQLTARVLRKKKYFTNQYQQAAAAIVAHVNDAPFMGYDAGEVFFDGMQKSDSGEDFVQLTFKFLVEKNKTGIVMTANELNSGDMSVDKNGWQYLWARMGQYLDEETLDAKNGPLTINVDTIYDSADFSVLGLTEADSEVSDDTDYGIL